MPEHRCYSCKWWGGRGPLDTSEPSYGRYLCMHEKTQGPWDDGDAPDGAGPADGTLIFTGPRFGCVHWEWE